MKDLDKMSCTEKNWQGEFGVEEEQWEGSCSRAGNHWIRFFLGEERTGYESRVKWQILGKRRDIKEPLIKDFADV